MSPFESYFASLLRPGVTVVANGTSNCICLTVDGVAVELYAEFGPTVPMMYFSRSDAESLKEISSLDDTPPEDNVKLPSLLKEFEDKVI
jgi:hypothetical protein